jgi:hypothetical protein
MAEFDFAQAIQGLLAGPSEEEKRAAKMQAIAQFGLGLLGTPKGQEFASIGHSASNALAGQADALQQARQSKMQGMQAAGQAMGLQETMQKFADDAKMRQVLQGAASGASPGGMPGAVPASGPSAPSSGLYQQLLAKADALEKAGLPQKAQEYRMLAEKYAPKYKGIESVSGPDGKPALLQTYENQAPTPMQGYGPKPDFKQVDTGGGVGFIDPWSQQQGPAFAKTNSPDSILSSETARRGQNMTDARSRELNAITQGQNQIAGGKAAFEAENKLRDEFTAGTKNFDLVRDGHARVLAAAKNPSAAGDIALITSYMKVLDPTSTVREGEFATAANAGGIPDKIRGMYNRTVNGTRLSDDVRKDFVNRSGTLYKSAEDQFMRQMSQSTEQAKRYGLKPENVIQDKRLPAGTDGGGPVKINGDADFAKLPSGAEFVGPDGVRRRKP